MTVKHLAHSAHQHIQSACGIPVARSHVHELLASAFGYGSWAAFRADCVLSDAGLGGLAPANGPALAGRALQLKIPQPACTTAASTLHALLLERGVRAMRWTEIEALTRAVVLDSTRPAPDAPPDFDEDELDFEDDLDFEGKEAAPPTPSPAAVLAASALLLDELGSRQLSPEMHHRLATAFRSQKPNAYLYEEAQKGRVLTKVEQAWVDQYLLDAPRYRAYKYHLRAAALGGVRQAAAEYAWAFEDAGFYERAALLDGEVDAHRMAELAPTRPQRHTWLRAAVEQGSRKALDDLAQEGDLWALEQLARQGDVDALRTLAEEAAGSGDALRAWAYQKFALTFGADFTQSDLRAYHSEGQRAGEFYDSDFGGPVHVDGWEAIELPKIDAAGQSRAIELAQRFAKGGSLFDAG